MKITKTLFFMSALFVGIQVIATEPKDNDEKTETVDQQSTTIHKNLNLRGSYTATPCMPKKNDQSDNRILMTMEQNVKLVIGLCCGYCPPSYSGPCPNKSN